MTHLQETETRPDAYDTALKATVTDVLDFHCMVAVWLGLLKHCGLGLKSCYLCYVHDRLQLYITVDFRSNTRLLVLPDHPFLTFPLYRLSIL